MRPLCCAAKPIGTIEDMKDIVNAIRENRLTEAEPAETAAAEAVIEAEWGNTDSKTKEGPDE